MNGQVIGYMQIRFLAAVDNEKHQAYGVLPFMNL